MIALLIAVLMLVLPLLHLAFSKVPRTHQRVVHILLLYALVLGVGVIGLPMGFIPMSSSPIRRRNSLAGIRAHFSSRLGGHAHVTNGKRPGASQCGRQEHKDPVTR
jgi:hypothetical protein